MCVSTLAAAADLSPWWNAEWRYRTTVSRPTPITDATARPVEARVDFARLLDEAGIPGVFDPRTVRVVCRGAPGRPGRETPCAVGSARDPETGRECPVVSWLLSPGLGDHGTHDLYFDTTDRRIPAPGYRSEQLPPGNLLANPGFEEDDDGKPRGWQARPQTVVQLGRCEHTSGSRSLLVSVDEDSPDEARDIVTVAQKLDVRHFAGTDMVFECDLFAEKATYGAPVTVELEQRRADGSSICEFAVDPRWLTLELAEGQLVQFRQPGRFSHDAATVDVSIRFRCGVRDADTARRVTGPEADFRIWLDRVAVRPAERWPWPGLLHSGFVEGVCPGAPLNRAFEFTGARRLVFNGASEGTLTRSQYRGPDTVHWGLQAGTMELWFRPEWSSEEAGEHVLFDTVAYGHRRQARLRKVDRDGKHLLEFTIADGGAKQRSVAGGAALVKGTWHHVAATWDFPKAHLQLFLDGKRIGRQGPGDSPWPYSLEHAAEGKHKGIGISDADARSMPMQAYIGGDNNCNTDGSAEAAIDEFRVSDVPRYTDDFAPVREEFAVDSHTRALFHFEDSADGVHHGDDRTVRGHLACELPRLDTAAVLGRFQNGSVTESKVQVLPLPTDQDAKEHCAENRLTVTRPFRALPDPRYVERRERHVERILGPTEPPFTITVGGDLPPLMRSVTFELADGNASDTAVLPRWWANGAVVPFSVESLRATLAPGVDDGAERALAIFRYATQVTNYYDAGFCETLPTRHRSRVSYTLCKALNIYPFDQCGPLNHTLRKLFLAGGVSSNNASGTHHQFEQAFYNGRWRLFDLSPRKYWLNRDNRTVAGRPDFEDDPYLKIRQGDSIRSGLRGRRCRATFGTAERPHSMTFRLRPGEHASLCWHNEGRWFETTGNGRSAIPLAKIPPTFGNGAIVYTPVESSDAQFLDNVSVLHPRAGVSQVRAGDPDKPGALVYQAECPYIFSDAQVSGQVEGAPAGAIALSLSFDEGKTWKQVWSNPGETSTLSVDLRQEVMARYAYWLKLGLAKGCRGAVSDLRVRSTIVASPLALPGALALGENRVRFWGERPAPPVRTVCNWVERYRSPMGVALNAIGYYMDGDRTHRNLFVARPGEALTVETRLTGPSFRGNVRLAGLPEAWAVSTDSSDPAGGDAAGGTTAELRVAPRDAVSGHVHGFEVLIGEKRRVQAQILVADAPLVREAEAADKLDGGATVTDLPEASQGRVVSCADSAGLRYAFKAAREGVFALWLRARWEPGTTSRLSLVLDEERRDLRAAAMIGFTDWTSPTKVSTKMFAHFGEQYGHWSWYRVPEVKLKPGSHTLTLEAGKGASFDALLLLPQNPTMDRAAMNLFQNWNYAPWDNPM